MQRHLTDLVVHNLPQTGKQYVCWDAGMRSFGVRVYIGKTFVIKQQNRYIILGRYPLISLKQARQAAKTALAAKYLPQTAKLTHEAIKEYQEAKKTEHRPYSQIIYNSYLKRLDNRPLTDIKPQYLYRVLPKGKTAQNMMFKIVKAFLSWCVERGYIETNPLLRRKTPNKIATRDRLLTDQEVRLIWQESYNHNSFGALIRVLLLTGQRLTQIAHLQSTWIHTEQLVFPYHIMKGRAEHVIPLTSCVKAQLESRASLIKPNTIAAPSREQQSPSQAPSLSGHSPADAPNLASLQGNTLFPKLQISPCMKKFREATPQIPHWTLHDFRRYLSSTMSKLKVPIDITEAILDHKSGSRSQIQRIYDRDSRLPQMRTALEQYESHLRTVVGSSTFPD